MTDKEGPDAPGIEVDPNAPPAPAQPEGGEDELATLRAEVADRKKEADDHRRAAEETRQALAEARREAETAVSERTRNAEIATDNAIAALEQERLLVQRRMAEARQAGDINAETQAIERLGQIGVAHQTATTQKQQIAAHKEQEIRRVEAIRKDPMQAFSAPTRAWLQAHPEAQPGRSDWQAASAADVLAKKRGIRPDTPEYFGFIEQQLGYAKDEPVQTADPISAGGEMKPARTPVSAAPPSRGNGGGQQRQPNPTLRLSDAERDIAVKQTSLGKTPEERIANYGLNKLKLQKEGRLPAA